MNKLAQRLTEERWRSPRLNGSGSTHRWSGTPVTGKLSKTATLPVHPVLRAELTRHRRPAGYIFQGRFGGHVTPPTIWDWTRIVAQEAGIPYLTTHQLRHTALATANDNLGDLRAVMEFARHSEPSVTAGYTRTTVTRLQDVVRSLEY